MKNCFLSILITVSFFSASGQNNNKFIVLPYQPKTMGHIFPEQYTDTKLSPVDLKTIDSLLSICISEYNKTALAQYNKLKQKNPQLKVSNFVIELESYRRQYVAAAVKGKRLVWVNCFCDSLPKHLPKDIVTVRDGGNCFFNLKINLTTRKYFDLEVNDDI